MKKLYENIKELNMITSKIKNGEEFKLNLIIILPLLYFMKVNDFISCEEFNMILSNKSLKIKELKYYKFDDFTKVSDKIDDYLSDFTDDVNYLLPKNVDIQSIDFLLYEILNNVYKHSNFKNAYLQIITPPNDIIELCIFDNGIGIPGSFKSAHMESLNDYDAIYEAINGKTSDKEKYGLHGRGLNSTARLTTLGFNGEMLIASGKRGLCDYKKWS